MIKSKLNEFEADWAAMPQLEKEKLAKLKHKTIIVSGHSLARCLCYALVYQSEQRGLDCRVIFAGDCSDFYAECRESDFFTSLKFDSLREIKEADFIIHTGFCGEKSKSFGAAFQDEISREIGRAHV